MRKDQKIPRAKLTREIIIGARFDGCGITLPTFSVTTLMRLEYFKIQQQGKSFQKRKAGAIGNLSKKWGCRLSQDTIYIFFRCYFGLLTIF